jgi:pimeloyl-ACP methyl ester carboxylesterase
MSDAAKPLFVLLHGGCHGGWCYERVAEALGARGFDSVAPTMAFDDPAKTLDEHADLVAALIPPGREAVVVGHSMGGLVAPLVATRRPLRHLALLCAVVPDPGRSASDLNQAPGVPGPSTVPLEALTVDANGVLRFASRDALHRHLYQDCDDAVVDAAWLRASATAPTISVQPSPLKEWPRVPTTSIIGTEDGAVNPEWSRQAARRVGAMLVELQGSSHSPFYSQVEQLTEVLAAL